jgi:catechol 2,3-dioxygenase-like lactoylglutathione lyase family enzyme
VKRDIGAITLFVADPGRSKEWYAKAFGLEPVFEDADSVVFRFDNTLVNLLRESQAGPMIEPAAVGSGSRLQLTIWVDDVDAEAERLGVELLNGPIDRPWGKRTAAFADPAGTVWEVAQDIPASRGDTT